MQKGDDFSMAATISDTGRRNKSNNTIYAIYYDIFIVCVGVV